jgi:hypothetical protein
MNEVISYAQVEENVVALRGQNVLLDCSVAELYGVETRKVNQAVKKTTPANSQRDMLFLWIRKNGET